MFLADLLRMLATVLALGLSPAPVATTSVTACHFRGALPDVHCTPGASDPRVTQRNIGATICRSGYTRSVRPPASATRPIKVEREIAYGVAGPHPRRFRSEELDHLVALELGGAPRATANLWPEPAAGQLGYRVKDRLENRLHDLVCARAMSLRAAQHRMSTDWVSEYRRQFG